MPEVKVLRDVADTLAKVMPAGKTLVLLVRPDRYVAAAAFSGADSLRQLAADMRDLLGKTISAQSAADPLSQACRRSTAGLRDRLPERTVVYARER
jgi:hypothetical protein